MPLCFLFFLSGLEFVCFCGRSHHCVSVASVSFVSCVLCACHDCIVCTRVTCVSVLWLMSCLSRVGRVCLSCAHVADGPHLGPQGHQCPPLCPVPPTALPSWPLSGSRAPASPSLPWSLPLPCPPGPCCLCLEPDAVCKSAFALPGVSLDTVTGMTTALEKNGAD